MIPRPRSSSQSTEAVDISVRASSVESNAGPSNLISTSVRPLPLPSIHEDRSFHAAEETIDVSNASPRKRAPRAKRVVGPSDRVLRKNPEKSAKARELAATITATATTNTTTTTTLEPSQRVSKRKADNMIGPVTKKPRLNTEAVSNTAKGATKGKAKAKAKVTKAPATKKAASSAPIGKGKKRAREDDDEDTIPPPPKKAREIAPAKGPKPKAVINQTPTQRLDVFVFGEGSSGELGLGTAKNAIDVKRPRLNPFLSSSEVGVVHIATGGMHAAALTYDNLIYTWGVNDQGALGRDTTWDGGMRDVDDSDDEDQDTNGLNPRECTPMAIPREIFPPGVVFVQLACGDSNTFALTDDGDVYGWGTFRVGFHPQCLSTVQY